MDIQVDAESFFTAGAIIKSKVGAVRSFCDAFASLNLSDLDGVSINKQEVLAAADSIEELSERMTKMIESLCKCDEANQLLYAQIDLRVCEEFGDEPTEAQNQAMYDAFVDVYEEYASISEEHLTAEQKEFLEENEALYEALISQEASLLSGKLGSELTQEDRELLEKYHSIIEKNSLDFDRIIEQYESYSYIPKTWRTPSQEDFLTQYDELYENYVNQSAVPLLYKNESQLTDKDKDILRNYKFNMEVLKSKYDAIKNKSEEELSVEDRKIIDEYNKNEYYQYVSEYEKLSAQIATIKNGIDNSQSKHYANNEINVKEQRELLSSLKNQLKDIENNMADYRSYMVEHGYVEMNAKESLAAAKEAERNAYNDYLEARKNGDREASEEAWKEYSKIALNTAAVKAESVLSGVGKVVEGISDGLVYAGGAIVSLGAGAVDIFNMDKDWTNWNKIWSNIQESTGQDVIGDMRDDFYIHTDWGRNINTNSALKYDSAGAKQLQSYSTKAGEVVIATAAGIATGGVAVPALTGLLYGFGSGAEEQFSKVDENGNYTHRNMKGIGLAALKGISKASEFFGYGAIANAASMGINALKGSNFSDVLSCIRNNWGSMSIDVKNSIKNNFDDLFDVAAKNTLKLKNTNGILGINDFYIDTVSMLADQIYNSVDSGNFSFQALLADAIISVPFSFLGNMLGEFGSSFANNFDDLFINQKDINSFYGKMSKEDFIAEIKRSLIADPDDMPSNVFIDTICNILENDALDNDDIKYIMQNLFLLGDINPKLKFVNSGDIVRRSFNNMDSKLYMDELSLLEGVEVIGSDISHEVGHTLLHTVLGVDKRNAFFGGYKQFDFNENVMKPFYIAQERLKSNPDLYINELIKTNAKLKEISELTDKWYEGIKDSEECKIKEIVEKIFSYKDEESLMIATNMLKPIFSDFDIEKIMSNKSELTERLININMINLCAEYDTRLIKTIGEEDSCISDFINSILRNNDPINLGYGETLNFNIGSHSNRYWEMNDMGKSYDELFADFFNLSANGKKETLERFKNMVGDDLYNALNKNISDIANKMRQVEEIRLINNKDFDIYRLDPDSTGANIKIGFLRNILEDESTFNKYIDFDNNKDIFGNNFTIEEYANTIKNFVDLHSRYDIELSDVAIERAKYIVDNYSMSFDEYIDRNGKRIYDLLSSYKYDNITDDKIDELLSLKTKDIMDKYYASAFDGKYSIEENIDKFNAMSVYNSFIDYIAIKFLNSDFDLTQESFNNISNRLFYLIDDNLEFSDYENQFIKVSKYVLNDNSQLSDIAYQKYLEKLCNYIAKRDNLPKVRVDFKDFGSLSTFYAQYNHGRNLVEFNTSKFYKPSKGFHLKDIDAAFHEMRHHYQEYNRKSSMSALNYYIVSDEIIRHEYVSNNDRYYKKNYNNISFEADARRESALQTIEFFQEVDPSLIARYEIDINSQIKEANIASKKVPSLGFKNRTKILNKIIKNNPKYVSEYPVLQYKYNMDGSIRSKDDVQQFIDYFNKLPESSENDQILTLLNIILEEIK